MAPRRPQGEEIDTSVSNDTTKQIPLSMTLLRLMDVCRSLEAFGVHVIRATAGDDDAYIQAYRYKPMVDWAKLNGIHVRTEPWEHPSAIFPYHAVAETDGVTVEALMTEDDWKEYPNKKDKGD